MAPQGSGIVLSSSTMHGLAVLLTAKAFGAQATLCIGMTAGCIGLTG